ncbi:hypothetical protein K488DRAFT_89510 [Vararia minispora EC-137]|uniref:Uncharacterized protein n=1 Tax=Vararia minispora EC-137 TaxID=1314806 RepID=A0ACB8QAQ5_9AGAM|nr:hypothetical protein K488DRAFT_89510 [Vararia minispora EC-137]
MSELTALIVPEPDDLLGHTPPPEAEYAKRMTFMQNGYALWSPSPSLIDSVRDPHVRVGDLGYIDNGKWRFLFNIHLQPGADGQAKVLPAQFEVLPRTGIASDDLPSSQQWSPQNSNSLNVSLSAGGELARKASLQYSFTVTSEASLAYIGPARREEVTSAYLYRYAQYTHRNCKCWERFLFDNGMSLAIERLVLVTSCTLASSWVTSVSCTQSSSVQVSLSASFDANNNIALSVGHTSNDSSGPMTNSGPVYRTTPPPNGQPVLDQCLFVKGFSPSIWDSVIVKVGEVGVDGGNRRGITLHKPSTFKHAALQYILQVGPSY